MKTEIKTSPYFSPVTVCLTLETPQELDAFGQLLNYTVIYDTLHELGLDTGDLAEDLEARGSRISGDGHQKLVSLIENKVKARSTPTQRHD